jgi:hypothetical protein
MVPADGSGSGARTDGAGADVMPTTLKTAAESYSRAKTLSRATRNEYLSTLRKWKRCPTPSLSLERTRSYGSDEPCDRQSGAVRGTGVTAVSVPCNLRCPPCILHGKPCGCRGRLEVSLRPNSRPRRH